MAAPVDAGRAPYNGSSSASSHNVTLPGSIAAGDLLVMALRASGGVTINTPSGWTALVASASPDAADDTSAIFWRRADGTEGATQTVTLSTSAKLAAITWRIQDALDPQVTAAATGASTTPNPPVTPALTGDYLFLWVGCWEGEQTSPPSGAPTNYTNAFGADTGTAGQVATNCRAAGASRQRTGLSSATEDPPSWTISASDDWTAWTVYIQAPTQIAASDSGSGSDASATVSQSVTDSGTGSDTSSVSVVGPVTGILDNFDRADGLPGSNWSPNLLQNYGHLAISGNALARGDADFESDYWNPSTFGPDCEAYCDIVTPPSNAGRLYVRGTNPDSPTFSGYELEFTTANSFLLKWVAGSRIFIVTLGVGFGAGDSVLLRAEGSTISAYRKPSGGSWGEIGSVTDTDVTGAGYIGVVSHNNTAFAIDNFGGGTLGSQSVTASDAGSAGDASTLAVALPVNDAGTGSESSALTVASVGTDAAAGAEASNVSLVAADSGAGLDASSLEASLAGADAGAGSEASTLSAALAATESGAGADSSSLDTGAVFKTASDTAAGADSAAAPSVDFSDPLTWSENSGQPWDYGRELQSFQSVSNSNWSPSYPEWENATVEALQSRDGLAATVTVPANSFSEDLRVLDWQIVAEGDRVRNVYVEFYADFPEQPFSQRLVIRLTKDGGATSIPGSGWQLTDPVSGHYTVRITLDPPLTKEEVESPNFGVFFFLDTSSFGGATCSIEWVKLGLKYEQDTATLTASSSVSESGTGTDTAVASAVASDSGAATDTASLTFAVTEAGSGIDEATASLAAATSDSGSASDTATVSVSFSLVESAVAADLVSSFVIGVSDSCVGTFSLGSRTLGVVHTALGEDSADAQWPLSTVPEDALALALAGEAEMTLAASSGATETLVAVAEDSQQLTAVAEDGLDLTPINWEPR